MSLGPTVHPGPQRRADENHTYRSSPCLSKASNRGMREHQDVANILPKGIHKQCLPLLLQQTKVQFHQVHQENQ